MSFEAVWGFDPEKALHAQKKCQQSPVQGRDEDETGSELNGDTDMRIPSTVGSQIYELRRIFRR